MLTANQLHKQSELDMDFQDFLQKMKDGFGDNFMDKVNQGKVKLEQIQNALGLGSSTTSTKSASGASVKERRKALRAKKMNQQVKKAKITSKPAMKSLSGDDSKPKCSSCQASKNASGDDKAKNGKAVKTFFILASLGAVVYWAVKNRK